MPSLEAGLELGLGVLSSNTDDNSGKGDLGAFKFMLVVFVSTKFVVQFCIWQRFVQNEMLGLCTSVKLLVHFLRDRIMGSLTPNCLYLMNG